MRGHLAADGAEQTTGSQSYVPPSEKDDKALQAAFNQLRGVTVNAVLPGNVATPGFADMSEEHQRRMLSSIPMGRYAEPEEVGWAVRFLASPEAGYITGQTLIVDGGQVLPEAPPL